MPNRLAYETSPYLLQHASNPVDWYPWGDKAFAAARALNKPVFLSVGYSTCHWCHVMAHESFEDTEVADLLNATFICVKVDREERPDIDHTYMAVCQMMTGSGGWPLTILMTPDKEPFFAATYIPRTSQYGRAGLVELVPKVAGLWRSRRQSVLDSAAKIRASLEGSLKVATPGRIPDENTLHLGYQELRARFDAEAGGFGEAPKFPMAHELRFLLRYWKRTGSADALQMVEASLQGMRRGGIFDQVGWGFHRYSTDRQWLVPHFEKMLYDQAQLAIAYTEAYQATGSESYRQTTREILDYVLRDMTDKEGGFHSAEDADSEGVEGKFYVWTMSEISDVLEEEERQVAVAVYGIQNQGNFVPEHGEIPRGANILHIAGPSSVVAQQPGMEEERVQAVLESARKKLLASRQGRVRPSKDDKVLADWNGLMIAALAMAGRAFDEQDYVHAARKAADFVLHGMRSHDGRLLHSYRQGNANIRAFADDYAFLAWGLIELYQASFDQKYIEAAVALNSELLARFWDERNRGFFFTPDDGEQLLLRQKQSRDGATPSANSVGLLNLLWLAEATENDGLRKKADELLRSSQEVADVPAAYAHFLNGLDFLLGPACTVAIIGRPDYPDTQAMLGALRRRFEPNLVLLVHDEGNGALFGPAADRRKTLEGKPTAYVCCGRSCHEPTADVNEMIGLVGRGTL